VNARLHVSGGALGGGRMVEDSSSIAGVLRFAFIFFLHLMDLKPILLAFQLVEIMTIRKQHYINELVFIIMFSIVLEVCIDT
jgi:hypothetical protein